MQIFPPQQVLQPKTFVSTRHWTYCVRAPPHTLWHYAPKWQLVYYLSQECCTTVQTGAKWKNVFCWPIQLNHPHPEMFLGLNKIYSKCFFSKWVILITKQNICSFAVTNYLYSHFTVSSGFFCCLLVPFYQPQFYWKAQTFKPPASFLAHICWIHTLNENTWRCFLTVQQTLFSKHFQCPEVHFQVPATTGTTDLYLKKQNRKYRHHLRSFVLPSTNFKHLFKYLKYSSIT